MFHGLWRFSVPYFSLAENFILSIPVRTLHSETSNRSKELPSFPSDYIVSMWLGCPSTKSGLLGRPSNTDCSEFWNSPCLPPPRPTQHPPPTILRPSSPLKSDAQCPTLSLTLLPPRCNISPHLIAALPFSAELDLFLGSSLKATVCVFPYVCQEVLA